jgi:hypothetical protein
MRHLPLLPPATSGRAWLRTLGTRRFNFINFRAPLADAYARYEA